ncbi:MAG TPA: hypothetical protein VGK96_27815 [Candidatus Sulfotelmatobacter sp.]|jgi:hypothetical protein
MTRPFRPFREFMRQYTGSEPGDPVKAEDVLFDVSRMDEPPLRLILGKFAKQYVKEGYEESLAELERWSRLSLSTVVRRCKGATATLENIMTMVASPPDKWLSDLTGLWEVMEEILD